MGSSRRWLAEHESDQYVKQSREEGYRSRAVYKLRQLDEKDRLLKRGQTVVDLGAAPGGWSQYALERVGDEGLVVALDILPMDPIDGVHFIQGDFTEDEPLAKLEALLQRLQGDADNLAADLVISDMAPNMTGIKAVDIPRSMYLAELAEQFARQHLDSRGVFVVKLFQGEGFDAFLKNLRQHYNKVWIRKPDASRDRSRELYLLARGPRQRSG